MRNGFEWIAWGINQIFESIAYMFECLFNGVQIKEPKLTYKEKDEDK